MNERWLWHGTSTTDPWLICKSMDGVDFRLVRSHSKLSANRLLTEAPCAQSRAGFYGRGAYFAERALYSHTSYVHDVEGGTKHQIILARVLCGKGKEMGRRIDRTLVKPPPGFHAVHGGPHKTHRAHPDETASFMWITYDRAQSYPAYVVTYTTASPRRS